MPLERTGDNFNHLFFHLTQLFSQLRLFPFSQTSQSSGRLSAAQCCKTGPERRKAANMVRDCPRSFQEGQEGMISRGIGIQVLLIWADSFSFNNIFHLTLEERVFLEF